MFNASKFIHTENGKILMSILLGLGLASLFRTICKDRNCIIFHAVDLDKIKDKVYKVDNKCYKYNMKSSICDSNKKIVGF